MRQKIRMNNNNNYISWEYVLRNSIHDSIDHDFIIIDNLVLEEIPKIPFKVNVTTIILCQEGLLEGNINLEQFKAQSPCLVVFLADRILEMKSISQDFKGKILIMSKNFTDNLLLDVKERLPLIISTEKKPCQPLEDESLKSLENYFCMMKKTIKATENPNRIEVARHLMLAFMYGLRFYYHPAVNEDISHNQLLVERFLALAEREYHQEHLLKYYADKLCLSAKHLSKVIKDTTGKPANEWIDDYIMLEAKALLKSTDMTIQQISDKLGFDNQSFFTKYFKRHLGKTPKQYKWDHSYFD